MATLIKVGNARINLDNVTHVGPCPDEEVGIMVNFVGGSFDTHEMNTIQPTARLYGEEAAAFLFVWDHMAVNALREYQQEQRRQQRAEEDKREYAAFLEAAQQELEAATAPILSPVDVAWCMGWISRREWENYDSSAAVEWVLPLWEQHQKEMAE